MILFKFVQYILSLAIANIALRRRRFLKGKLLPSNACYDDATALLCGGLRFAKCPLSINDLCSAQRLVRVRACEEALVNPRMLVNTD